jgi:hypothetical protein
MLLRNGASALTRNPLLHNCLVAVIVGHGAYPFAVGHDWAQQPGLASSSTSS